MQKIPREPHSGGSFFILYYVCENSRCPLVLGVLIMGEVQNKGTLIVSQSESLYGAREET